MCVTCGCSETEKVTFTDPRTGRQVTMPRIVTDAQASPAAPNAGGQAAAGSGGLRIIGAVRSQAQAGAPPSTTPAPAALHAQMHATTIKLEQEILAKNDLLAERNRRWFKARGIVALNLMSSPGSGKTSLLERTIRDIGHEIPMGVIEGDQATLNDAERIRATGVQAIQINLGTGCHLEADMLERGLEQLAPPPGSVVMIENVGNLVCPALFDLGEAARVVILSVTEGEDKPAKYPHMFKAAQVMIVNKIDLLPYLKFDLPRCIAIAREMNPDLLVLCVSAQTGEGMADWYDWLRRQRSESRAVADKARPGALA